MNQTTGRIHSVENFATVDGPGVRYVVFVQGCPLRCQFCHNPDTWDPKLGTIETVDEVLNKAEHFREYWGKDGGLTVSGGEPLLQIDFVTELFKEAKKRGIHTCLDTSGGPFRNTEKYLEKFNHLMEYTDLVMLDIKQIDDEAYKELTGHTNKNILEMAEYLSKINKPTWIRHVLVPGGSDRDDYLKRLNEFIQTLHNVYRVEILPYHTLGTFKYKNMNLSYPLDGVEPPTKERVENARRLLHTDQYTRWEEV